ncbi:hypothetical protein BGZ58_006075, partial [Dissophora ornata]
MDQTPRRSDEALIADIICQNPKLFHADIPCDGERSNEIIKLVTSTTERIEQGGTATALEVLKFDGSKVYDIKGKRSLAITSAGLVSLHDPRFELDTDIEIDGDNPIDEKDIPGVFRRYGWLIKKLRASGNFSDSLAGFFEEATRSTIPRLKRLVLDPRLLTPSGLDCMDRVIERAEILDDFSLELN